MADGDFFAFSQQAVADVFLGRGTSVLSCRGFINDIVG